MDMTCRCKAGYTCVAHRVERGDYRDWTTTPRMPRPVCSEPSCDRLSVNRRGWCWKHYNNQLLRVHAGRKWPAIPMRPYVKMAER